MKKYTSRGCRDIDSMYDYYMGRVIGDALSMLVSAGITAAAITEILGALLLGGGTTVLSGGTLVAPGMTITVTGIAAGTATIAYGGVVLKASSKNLGNDYNKMIKEREKLTKGESRGQSKGGHQPQNLKEQLAVQEAAANPDAGRTLAGKNTDPRWPASEGWVKKAQNVNGVEVHYEYNLITGQVDDIKIK